MARIRVEGEGVEKGNAAGTAVFPGLAYGVAVIGTHHKAMAGLPEVGVKLAV
jgi:deoxyinosine 3'endonuclease (endonuclease V)